LNGRGQAVGNTTTNDGASWRGFFWEAGHARDLGTLGGHYTFVYDVNDSGVAVGVSEISDGERVPFLWHDGVMTALIEPGDDPDIWRSGAAYAINDSGQVVGVRYAGNGEAQAYSWQAGTFTNLTPPGDSEWTRSVAWDVNADGVIVGEVSSNEDFAAARWQNGVLTLLDGGSTAISEAALAVNRAGAAVGRNTDTELGRRAAAWDDGAVRYLPLSEAVATALNDHGTIVGRHRVASGARSGFVLTAGRISDLEAVTAQNPYANTEAIDVDDRGHILGNGFLSGTSWNASEAVLWTPTQN
jgi:probable HAF family extracellular repeat protein